MDIRQWQERFRQAPTVWVVYDADGCITNLYDSEAAAQFEIDACPKEKDGPEQVHIHDVALARERWGRRD